MYNYYFQLSLHRMGGRGTGICAARGVGVHPHRVPESLELQAVDLLRQSLEELL